MFEINNQIEEYLEARGKIILNACPGSGKTTAIAKKLIGLQDECKTLYNNYCGVACLSFTNTAKDETYEKYRLQSGTILKFPHVVSTIDSFINQYITLPFYYLLNKDFKRPKILEDNKFIDDVWKAKLNYKGIDDKPFCFAYIPSSIRFEKDGGYSSNGNKPSYDKVKKEVFEKYCKDIKSWQLSNGLITTGDSAYVALWLLNNYPKIGIWLTNRFPYIIIDEAQDNSEIQYAIFDLLINLGLKNIEFVGDPYQSLYEWRDAKPELFLQKFANNKIWQGLFFTGNRRSNQRIIDVFSIIRRKNDPPIKSDVKVDFGLPITIYKYNNQNITLIIENYEKYCFQNNLRKNQIVVRGNTLKNKLIGKELDYLPWKSPFPYLLIEVKNFLFCGDIKSAIKLMREIIVNIKLPDSNYHERKDYENNLKDNYLHNAHLLDAIKAIPSLNNSINNWTEQTQIFVNENFKLEKLINFELKERNSKYFDKSILNDPMDKHFKKSSTEKNIPITTIHQVKGITLDSILIIFNENIHKENIVFSDINNEHDSFPSEKQRMIYVAMSRPEHLLAMAFPESIKNDDIISKFGDKVKIENVKSI